MGIFDEIQTAASPRDCPQGAIYIDELDGFLRAQVVGGERDGDTVFVPLEEAT